MFLRVLLWDAVPLGGEQWLQQCSGMLWRVGSGCPACWGTHLLMTCTHSPGCSALLLASYYLPKLLPIGAALQGHTRDAWENWRDRRDRGTFGGSHPTASLSYVLQMTAVDMDILIRLEDTEDEAKVIQQNVENYYLLSRGGGNGSNTQNLSKRRKNKNTFRYNYCL